MRTVSYLRVSTARQGSSGLGLEAQRSAVAAFNSAASNEHICEFVEVESGSKSNRPKLEAALAACRAHRATLLIAKLDRLARNVAFIANLLEGGVDFVACDMPHANRLTLHLLSAIAEHERHMISERTKAALAAAKARGTRLGNPQGAAALREGCRTAALRSASVRAHHARGRARVLAPILLPLRQSGLSYAGVAQELNRRAFPAPNGGRWHSEQVRRTFRMLEEPAPQ